MLTGMGFMTGNTVTGSHRAMAVTLCEDFGFMAVKTETADTGAIAPELKTHGRFMGVMTGDAALFNRCVDHAIVKLPYLGLVTDHAQILTGTGHGHGIIGAMGAMAGYTDSRPHRAMDMGCLAHIGMAAGGTG